MLFGVFDRDSYFRLMTTLLWQQHGGSGFNLTHSDLHDMPIKELLRWYDDLGTRRKSEADAIRRANK